MSVTNRPESPFEPLGKQLKRMRISRRETLAEVSGAVEIEIEALSIIEQGTERPNEEILLLLISHFGIKDDEADSLWKMAGYDEDSSTKLPIALPAEDMKIVYTDMLHVTVNNYGVVMNFLQGGNGQPVAIARVGMSREHAQSIVELLQKTLSINQPRMLPAPNPSVESQESQTD